METSHGRSFDRKYKVGLEPITFLPPRRGRRPSWSPHDERGATATDCSSLQRVVGRWGLVWGILRILLIDVIYWWEWDNVRLPSTEHAAVAVSAGTSMDDKDITKVSAKIRIATLHILYIHLYIHTIYTLPLFELCYILYILLLIFDQQHQRGQK